MRWRLLLGLILCMLTEGRELVEGTVGEGYDFGKAMATGLCKMPGLNPIVSFPKWGSMTPDQPSYALASISSDGFLARFSFQLQSMEEANNPDPARDLVCVQALYCPQDGSRLMWVLDSGHGPAEQLLAEGAAKLLRVHVDDDGRGGNVERAYRFRKSLVPDGSYLNDVRVDDHGYAYITDSNNAAIIVLDLGTGEIRVWSDRRMKPQLEEGERFHVGGVDLSSLLVGVDGIAYSKRDDLLYWKPVTRSSLFRVPASVLRRGDVARASAEVEDLGYFGFHDGLDADLEGNVFLTDLVNGSIQRRSADGKVSWISEKGSMHWPDCVIASEGSVFVLTTQVHLMPFMNNGNDLRTDGNKLVRIPHEDETLRPKGRLEEVLSGRGNFPLAMPSIPNLTVPEQLACAARILAASGYALDVAGHISVVRPDDRGSMWSTPYGVWWRDLTAADMLVIDADGKILEGIWDVTPAIAIHTEIHRARPDARVIIHNHPHYGSLLGAMHVVPEISEQQACMFDGNIAFFNEYTGGIDNAADGRYLARQIGNATAIILANHGVLITGETVAQATYRAVTFERTCRLHYEVLAAGRSPVPVPVETRHMLKRSLNTISVDSYWRGQVRHVIRTSPDLLNGNRHGDLAHATCTSGTCTADT